MRTKNHSTYLVPQVTLWFGFLGSAVAWFIHFIVVYLLAEAVCIVGLPGFDIVGIPGITVLLVIITATALALCVASGLTAHRNRTKLDREYGAAAAEVSRGASQHLANGGTYLSIFFSFTIVVQLFPVFFMRACP